MKRRTFIKNSAMSLTFVPFVLNQWALGQKFTNQIIEVDVYVSTPSGVFAAIGAAREGASAVLIEPTNHIGGVNTGGLSFSDSSQVMREAMGGLWRKWHQRIEEDYQSRGIELPYKVDNENGIVWTYEPHVAMRVTLDMLTEDKVKVISESPIISLTKNANSIDEIYLDNDMSFKAKVFIDCIYEGDLMAMAGVDWVIGREGKSEFNESLAGKRFEKPVMNISGYNEEGDLQPLITTDYRGIEGDGDEHVMTYSFRLCMTNNPENRIAFPEPKNYDPTRFEMVRQYYKHVFPHEELKRVLWDLYPLPNGKFDANNSIMSQFSIS